MNRYLLATALTLCTVVGTTQSATISSIQDVTLLSGSPLHIPLNGLNANGQTLTFSATSSNALVSTFIPENNRSMRISVPTFGDMVFELFEQRAGRVTDHIIDLAQSGFYDGVIFHRILDEFVIQGGDPTGTGSGGSSLGDFDDQFHVDLQHNRTGLLSMAKTTDDTNDSQFFITDVDPTSSTPGPRHLDANHSIFGLLTSEDTVRQNISDVAVDGSGRPDTNVVMESVEIFVDNENAVLMLKAPENTSGNADITVTVTDDVGVQSQVTFHVTVQPDTINSAPFLADIPAITTDVDTQVIFQLESLDAEGDSAFYLDEVALADNFLPVPVMSHDDLDYEVVFSGDDAGRVTVTPKNGLTGTFFITVATAVSVNAVDYQVVPITIGAPAAAATPEPSTMGLVAVGLMSLLRRRQRSA